MVLGQFTWHVLCWGVWHDYSDLDGALHCLQAPLQSSLARSSLTLLVALLVNVPVLLSFLIFILQTAGSVSDWYVPAIASLGNVAFNLLTVYVEGSGRRRVLRCYYAGRVVQDVAVSDRKAHV